MTENTDYFFWNVKELYPNFGKPSRIDNDIWADILNPYSKDEIYKALKSYRKSEKGAFIPIPSRFKEFLYPYDKKKTPSQGAFCLPEHLMKEDIRAGRCKHLFPTYVSATNYILNVKLKEVVGDKKFAECPDYASRIGLAIEECLFADLEPILDYVHEKRL